MSVTREKPVVSKILQKNMLELLSNGIRIDKRKLDEYRKISYQVGIIEKADGSALLSLGETMVLVGVKVELGQPFEDTPDQGVLVVNAELLPLASQTFEPGPPDERAIALARYVDRSIRESNTVDLKSLTIVQGKICYVVYVDVYVLDYGGNLVDASVLAAVKALENTKIKKYELDENGKIMKTEKVESLKLNDFPVSITFGIINNKYFVDPSLEEEQACDTFLTFTYTKSGNICAVMKNEQGLIAPAQVIEMMELGWKKAKEISSLMLG
ncbi:MAG: exosome complex protein Rrp42, partial [Candidatus Brockarchaeota archaeon]|nr:exosome complex protein Rrp42 [Candidatus Brockarchaeota archaeon]